MRLLFLPLLPHLPVGERGRTTSPPLRVPASPRLLIPNVIKPVKLDNKRHHRGERPLK
ncbi:MAG: hypothetical protein KME21_28610 [Desmonostoc vinosum HA7617-LM4]|nr:hypothetical protein [Desmonostoc vinosum HA7617-LM4]